MTPAEALARGHSEVDIVFVTGDAYVDHPSFAMAIIGRVLEAAGFAVGIVAQPDWQSAAEFRRFGRPRLFFAVSAGNMDSMINHYTANKLPRSDDAYSPGGKSGSRPDRATAVYAQRCREAYPGVPVIVGGVEASLRRLAHFDYWSETVKPSMLVSSKADLLVFGMGERVAVEIAGRFKAGGGAAACRDLRGVAYLLGKNEALPPFSESMRASATPVEADLELPTFEAVAESKLFFAKATRLHHLETNPLNARRLLQRHGDRLVVQNPPALPLERSEMDWVYDLPYTRKPHPSYSQSVPAFDMIKNSVTIMRGCFGGCTFCSITAHEGRIIQSRSQESVLGELRTMAADPKFSGTVSDIGGPTANMYEMRCTRPEVEAKCKRASCVHPTVCRLLGTSHDSLRALMKKARERQGVKRVFVASGIRTDLARLDPGYIRDLAEHHVGGLLKVAPEHANPDVLQAMKKPPIDDYDEFAAEFRAASRAAGKKQFLVPYFIASHPGSGTAEMIDLALYLKRNGYKPDQVQDFIPSPMDVATCMYYTGLDPMTLAPVKTAKKLRDRKMQRALLQFFKPENWFEVREALLDAGRGDLIGDHCDALIPARAPAAALEARRKRAAKEATDAAGGRSVGYRPHRPGWKPRRPDETP